MARCCSCKGKVLAGEKLEEIDELWFDGARHVSVRRGYCIACLEEHFLKEYDWAYDPSEEPFPSRLQHRRYAGHA
jgi:hypothetical protein